MTTVSRMNESKKFNYFEILGIKHLALKYSTLLKTTDAHNDSVNHEKFLIQFRNICYFLQHNNFELNMNR